MGENPDKNFIPFDRFAQKKISQGKSMGELLLEFTQLRTERIQQLKALNITEDKLSFTGIHPEFGNISLKQLLAAWVVHDLGHIAQINRVTTKQYTAIVGPWTKYLGILNT